MKFLELPMEFMNNEDIEELERLKDLGLPTDSIKSSIDTLYVNPKQIVAFNKDSNGNVNLSLPYGGYTVMMKFDEFLDLINEFEV